MVDKIFPITSSTEEKIDFSDAVTVKSMLDVYRDIESSRCSCDGKLFPSGPVNLKPPDGSEKKILFRLMILYCTKCSKECNRVYAIDTSSKEYLKEQANGFNSNPRWERLVSGNPINTDELP